jgi:hypothetical protein
MNDEEMREWRNGGMAQEGDGTGECANSDLSKHKLTIRPLVVMDRPFSRHRQYRDRQTNMNKCLPICKYKQKKGEGREWGHLGWRKEGTTKSPKTCGRDAHYSHGLGIFPKAFEDAAGYFSPKRHKSVDKSFPLHIFNLHFISLCKNTRGIYEKAKATSFQSNSFCPFGRPLLAPSPAF